MVDVEMLRRARDTMPPSLNAGLLFGEGGFCVLGWLLYAAGFHEITLFGNTIAVADPARGGAAPQIVAETYGLPIEVVESLAQLNDRTPSEERVAAITARLDDLLLTDGPS